METARRCHLMNRQQVQCRSFVTTRWRDDIGITVPGARMTHDEMESPSLLEEGRKQRLIIAAEIVKAGKTVITSDAMRARCTP